MLGTGVCERQRQVHHRLFGAGEIDQFDTVADRLNGRADQFVFDILLDVRSGLQAGYPCLRERQQFGIAGDGVEHLIVGHGVATHGHPLHAPTGVHPGRWPVSGKEGAVLAVGRVWILAGDPHEEQGGPVRVATILGDGVGPRQGP